MLSFHFSLTGKYPYDATILGPIDGTTGDDKGDTRQKPSVGGGKSRFESGSGWTQNDATHIMPRMSRCAKDAALLHNLNAVVELYSAWVAVYYWIELN